MIPYPIYRRRITQTASFLSQYKTGKPAQLQLSAFFKTHKQMGSKDRKSLRSMVYNWFRAGSSFEGDREHQIMMANALLDCDLHEELTADLGLPSSWHAWSLKERSEHLQSTTNWQLDRVFPVELLSEKLDKEAICLHQFTQPLVWLTGPKPASIAERLAQKQIRYEENGSAVGVDQTVPLGDVLQGFQFQVQDLSSQKVLEAFSEKLSGDELIWDACAGSGGKTLKLLNLHSGLDIMASDVRPEILKSLHHRAKGMSRNVATAQIDLTKAANELRFESSDGYRTIKQNLFDVLVLDVPCTGSGTWNRNPEFVHSFDGIPPHLIALQEAIIDHSLPFLKPGGLLLYMTCSVFSAENEAQCDRMADKHQLDVIESGYHKGYQHQSDSMYYAIFKKP